MKGTLDSDYARQREKRLDFRYRLRRRTQEVARTIESYSGSPEKILDLGTAEGRMLADVRDRHPGAFCIGIDYSLGLLQYGAQRFRGLHFICADLQQLCLRERETFDVIIATAVIEHLSSPVLFLQNCKTLLKKNGILVMTVPHSFWEKIAGRLGLIKGEHQSHFSSRELLDLCAKGDFLVLEHKGFMISPVGFWGEIKIEKVLAGARLDKFLPNQLVVAQKKAPLGEIRGDEKT